MTGVWRNKVEVAVKTLAPGKMTNGQFLQEAEILHKVRHRHIVMLMGVCTVGEPTYIIMELVKHGQLKAYLRKCKKEDLPFEVLMNMAAQVCIQSRLMLSYFPSLSDN